MRKPILLSVLLLFVLTLLILPSAPAHAQSPYRLEADDFPPNVTNHASFRAPPTTVPPRLFFHWDLREFTSCDVPFAINVGGHADPDLGNEFLAVDAAVASWDAVTPSILDFVKLPLTATNLAGRDNENVYMWDNGNNPAPSPNDQATTLFMGAPSNTIAVACLFYDGRMKILESDIVFNDRDFTWIVGVPAAAGVVDVQTIATHEIGHFLGLHHSATPGPPGGPIMTANAPGLAIKRALTAEDRQALNFLYTPDMGDAPDPWRGVFNEYQSLVHGSASGDTLNGIALLDPAEGPVHLFGHRGPSPFGNDQFEWLGAGMDGHPAECESRQTDADLFDDGVVVPVMTRGAINRITVTVTHTGQAGRYVAANPLNRLYFNGYMDFPDDCSFDVADLEIWWDGVPGTTVAASANFVPPAVFGPTTITLNYDVMVPANAKDKFYCRWRLDYGEDEGIAPGVPLGGWSGDLGPATGAAQFGEVEDDLCATVEIDHFPESLAEIDLRFPAGEATPHLVELTGPTTVHVDLGAISDSDGDGREQVTTEMVELNLTGTSPTFGQIVVRLQDPGLHGATTTGEIEETNSDIPGLLEIPPFTEGESLCADSFFDVFVEVELVDQAITLHNHSPKRMSGTIYEKPPREGDTYFSPDFIPLFDASESLVAEIGPGYHIPHPPKDPGETDIFPNSLGQIDIRFPADSVTPDLVELTGPTAVFVDLAGIGDRDGDGLEEVRTRMLGMDLTGFSPNVGVVNVRRAGSRNHPFQPTYGEIEETSNGTIGTLDLPPFVTSPPGLSASTFFDIFFEVELPDLGVVLHNHLPKHLSGTIYNKPPGEGDTYSNPDFIPLYDDSESLVAMAGPGYHIPNPGDDETEVDIFPASLAEIDLRIPATSPAPHLVTLTGPTTVLVDLGGIGDTDGDLLEQVTTEITDMHLTGGDATFGRIIVRQRPGTQDPFQRSTGEIEENSNLTPGTLDLPPFVEDPPGLQANSFFNVFPEIELPDLGLTLHTHEPKLMTSIISRKPPAPGETYQSPIFIPLFDESESIVGAIGPGLHIPFPDEPFLLEPGYTVTTLPPGLGSKGLRCSPGGIWGEGVYAADSSGNNLVRITPAGNIVAVAGGVSFPVGMEFGPGPGGDFGELLYVGEFGSGQIVTIDPAGTVTVFAAFNQPGNVRFDPSGFYGTNLFASTAFSGPIQTIDPGGIPSPFSSLAATYLNFGPGGPWGTGLYSSQHDATPGIAQVAPDGNSTLFVGGYSNPEGFDWADGPGWNGDMFTTDMATGEIWRVTPAGVRTLFALMPGAADLAFCNCAMYAVSASGGCWKITNDQDQNCAQAGIESGILHPFVIDKTNGPDLNLSWGGTCQPEDENFAIYSGEIGDFYSHTRVDCFDNNSDAQEIITPLPTSRYYIVVPLDSEEPEEEGDYGVNSGGGIRPRGTETCAPNQVPGSCPTDPLPVQETEPNDSCGVGETQQINLGDTVVAAISQPCDFDVFSFSVDDNTQVDFQTISAGDTVMRLSDQACGRLGCDDDSADGFSSLISGCLPPGDYVIEVRGFSPDALFTYTLESNGIPGCVPTDPITTTGDEQNLCDPTQPQLFDECLPSEPADIIETTDFGDCNSGSEAFVDLGNTVAATIDPTCDFDAYRFNVGSDTQVNIQGGGGVDTALMLTDPACGRLACDDDTASGGAAPYEPALQGCLAAGDYVVRVRPFSNSATFSYTLDFEELGPCNSTLDPPVQGDEAFTCTDFDTCL